MELINDILIMIFFVLCIIYMLSIMFASYKEQKLKKEYRDTLKKQIVTNLESIEVTKKLMEAEKKKLKKIGEENDNRKK